MPSAADLICDTCGAPLPTGLGSLLCPHCLLREMEPAQRRIGSCVIEQEISRGGMGIVYRAVQEGLDRPVALKVLPAAFFAGEEARARFKAESAAAARLRHPGIVVIHEVGEHEGQPYFTMDLIEGPSLEALLRDKPPPTHFAAGLCQRLAEAVAAAHAQGVFHRDIKPSNVLLDARQSPVLTDFGLARLSDQHTSLTISGQIIGTPSYLPPERASGSRATGLAHEAAGDVYGIGAVLYHLLTGRPPFVGEGIAQTLEAVVNEEPVPPGRLRPGMERDVETICLKCLQKEPAARYASAQALADDLARFIRGEPIKALPVGQLTRSLRWCRRRPVMTALALALILSILAGVSSTLVQWRAAVAERDRADHQALLRLREVYTTDMIAAHLAEQKGDVGQARALLARHVPAPGQTDMRGFEWHLLSRQCTGRELAVVKAHTHIVTSAAWSQDGTRLASGDHRGGVRVWQRQPNGSLQQLHEWKLPHPVRKLHWLAADQQLLIAGPDGKTLLVSAADGHELRSWPGACASLSADGRWLAIADSGAFYYDDAGAVTLYSMPEGRAVRQVSPRGRATALSADGSWLAVGVPHHGSPDDEHDVDLYNLRDPEAKPRRLVTDSSVWAMEFSPDSQQLAACLAGHTGIPVWSVASGQRLATLTGHEQRSWSIRFLDGGKTLLSTGSDRSIRLWDAHTFTELPATGLVGHENEIWCAAVHPDGTQLVSGDKDGVLRQWAWPPRQESPALYPSERYGAALFSTDERQLCLRRDHGNGPAGGWCHDLATSKSWQLADSEPPIGLAADGSRVAVLAQQSEVLFYQGKNEQPVRKLKLDLPAGALAIGACKRGINSAGTHLFYLNDKSGEVQLFSLQDGQRTAHAQASPTEHIGAAISHDARWLVSSTWFTLDLTDLRSGQTTTIKDDVHWALAMVFQPDGQRFITAGIDGTIKVWSLPDTELIATLRGHLENAGGLSLSPDGQTLASIELHSGVRLWRMDTLREVMFIPVPEALESVQFSPQGTQLALWVRDGSRKTAVRLLSTR
jgi:WD40 repeat protein